MKEKKWHKFGVLFCLYIAQSVPMSFFSTVVPVIMRQQHYSLESIGLLQMVKLPWIFKFLWAPIIDKKAVDLRGLKRWILYSELFYAVIIIATAFFNLDTDFKLIVILMVIAFIASATQDIATDAMAIRILKPGERSFGNSMQSAGSFGGSLLGTGVLLVIYHFFGWSVLLYMLAAFVLIALIPLSFYRKKSLIDENRKATIRFTDIALFFKGKESLKRVLFLLFYYSGIIGILAMLKPFMVDEGFTIKEIGFISGIVGTSIATASALLSGVIVKKIGRKQSAILFATIGIIAAFYFWQLTHHEVTHVKMYIGVCLLWGAYGLSTVVVYTTSMDFVRSGREGTDFTIQIVLTHLSSLIIAINSGKIGDALGYSGLYKIETGLGVLALLLSILLISKSSVTNESR